MADLFPLLWKQLELIFDFKLFEVGNVVLTPWKLMVSALYFWIFNMVSYVIERMIRKSVLSKDPTILHKTPAERFARYGILLIGIIVILAYLGINPRSIETFGAVLGLGLGFGLQNITQNFISGIILLTEKPIKRGDIVVLENGLNGRVLDIRARSTYILTRDDVVIVVPNSDFISKQVTNESFSGSKIRYSIDVGVAYGADEIKVRELLLDIANNNPYVLKTPPSTVTLTEFADPCVKFSLLIWISELWFHQVILSDIRFEIIKKLKENKIPLPFPLTDQQAKK